MKKVEMCIAKRIYESTRRLQNLHLRMNSYFRKLEGAGKVGLFAKKTCIFARDS